MARQTSLLDAVWIEVKDGDDTARDIFKNHYSAAERLAVGKILRGSQFPLYRAGRKDGAHHAVRAGAVRVAPFH